MDRSNRAVFVNTEQLRKYVGRRVWAVIQVIHPDAGGIIGKSSDEHQRVIKGHPSSQHTTFVETHNYNQLCQLANGEYQHLFIC